MAKKKEAEEKVPGMKGMMVHCDGSARPNGVWAGWGMHGYIYEATEPTKGTGNSDYVLTANDYLTKVEKATMPALPLVTPLYYVDGFGALPHGSSNNQAELTALIEAFKLALDQDVKKLRIWSDSNYTVKGITIDVFRWEKNGWRLASGEPAKNVDLWEQAKALYLEVQARGIDVAVNWVKGHGVETDSGTFGNELADGLAFVGMRYATNGQMEKRIDLSPPEGYWKYDSNRHPFIMHRRMYYNTLPETNIPGEYCLGEHDKDDDLAGKRMANGAYAYVRLEQPEPALEAVRRHSCEVAAGEDTVMIARVDYIYKAEVHRYLKQYGNHVLNNPSDAKSRLDAVVREKKEHVTREHNPPLLIARCENELAQLKEILDDYLAGNTEMVTTDITPLIYESLVETNKKGDEKRVTKLRSEFVVGTDKMSATVNYRRPGQATVESTNINLLLGLDLLDRNALRRLEDLEPEVRLVTWSEEPQAFRFATIIKVNGAVGIWSGSYSNLRLLNPQQ
jgi:ribonuclease HI